MRDFDQNAFCPKCGFDKIHSMFIPSGKAIYGDAADRHGTSWNPVDRIERRCERCFFEWDELPLDAIKEPTP